jgi:transposase
MAMGKRERRRRQEAFWIAADALPTGASHPFYRRLNHLLEAHHFDEFVEGLCQRFYAQVMGRPGLQPGIYFRLLLIGYFEGIDSERGIAWRSGDSLALRAFLGLGLDETTPDHRTISRTRRLMDLETHREVFAWVLRVLAENGLLKGKTIGIDATSLEANAALRSIVRRDTSEQYSDFLARLAQESGIETPTREQLAKLDRKRPNKGSNEDWAHPHDPDARITKMKDGRTHLAHKAEHAVDLDTGAVVAVTVQPADCGDTTTVLVTATEAALEIVDVAEETNSEAVGERVRPEGPAEIVMDKGYHSNDVMVTLKQLEVRTYCSEPDRGRRNWSGKQAEQSAVYANRRRVRSSYGRALLRKRGELIERSFAHIYDTGGMRRTHLRRHANILKRLLVHVAGFNLSLLMRKYTGKGTPRALQENAHALLSILEMLSRLTRLLKEFE